MSKAIDIVYKIRRKSDGLFSMGGSNPHFNKTGKIWKQKGHLTNHLNQMWNDNIKVRYSRECEIVLYEIIEKEIGEMTIGQYLNEREDRLRKEKEERQSRIDAFNKEKRREEYEKLKKEFENE